MSEIPADVHDEGEELQPELLQQLKIEVPGYDLLQEIGHGGQGVVYKASSQANRRIVAIKLLWNSGVDDAARERLKREGRLLAAMNNPHIVTSIDDGQTADGRDYLVMNYIAGSSLEHIFTELRERRRAFDRPQLLKLFRDICAAVNVAHLCGITHRDLSPSNILVNDEFEPFILDFGAAKTAFDRHFHDGPKGPSLPDQFLGKLAYACPDRVKGDSDKIDLRSDVYSLGVMLYEAITAGRYPYDVSESGGLLEALTRIATVNPVPPSQRVAASNLENEGLALPPIDPGLDAIVLKALAKQANDRHQSAGALGQALQEYLASGVTPPPPPPRVPPWPLLLKAAIGVGLALFLGLYLYVEWQYGWAATRARQEPGPSTQQSLPSVTRPASAVDDAEARNKIGKEAESFLKRAGSGGLVPTP